jgi:hypothetical protein
VESRILGEFGLFVDDHCAAFLDTFVLAVFLYELFYKVGFSLLFTKT